LEPIESLLITRGVFRQELQGDKSPELNVLGFIDDPHPATAQPLNHAVVRDALADERVLLRHSGAILGIDFTQVNKPGGATGPRLSESGQGDV
jgi:hypothetical protein